MQTVVKNEVLLFKSFVEDADQEISDPYAAVLKQALFTVKTIPVLWFYYTHLIKLQGCLLNPNKYSGLIFTSPRAVQAAALSLESATLPSGWQSLPVFVVGEGTANVLSHELGLTGQGVSTGNASNLADLILEREYQSPLLFPCGNMKRDTLPNKLREKGVDIHIITVYESQPHPDIADNIKTVTLNGNKISEFIVYFSPSGVQFTMPMLHETIASCEDIKIVAIGPTTRSCLEQAQIKVWSSARKPSPDCLLQAILKDFGPNEVYA